MVTKFVLLGSINAANARMSEAITICHLSYNHIDLSHSLQRGISPLFYNIPHS